MSNIKDDDLWVVDAESVGLLPAIRYGVRQDLHVLHFRHAITNEERVFFDPYEMRNPETRVKLGEWEGQQTGDLMDGVQLLKRSGAFAFHNGLGYDALLLEKVFPEEFRGFNWLEARGKNRYRSDIMPLRMTDTLVMSRMLNPDRRLPGQAYGLGLGNIGPHTIESHGIRVGRYKPHHEDWSRLTDDMIHRVREDTWIGRDYLLWMLNGEWKEHMERGANPRTGLTVSTAFRMESNVALEIARQAERGFTLDVARAISRVEELDKEIQSTDAAFRPHMPMRLKSDPLKPLEVVEMVSDAEADCAKLGLFPIKVADFAGVERKGKRKTMWLPKLTKKNGDWTAAVQKDFPHLRGNSNDTNPLDRVGPYCPVEFEDIPLGNRDTVKQVLYQYGWRGVEFNDTEQEYMEENGEWPKPWSGKINEKSLEVWKKAEEAKGGKVPEWCLGIARWYILSSRRNQILNYKDQVKYDTTGAWPTLPGGKGRGCRGVLPAAFSRDLGINATKFYEVYKRWPTLPEDGEWRVPAIAISIGTSTFRMRHRVVVNIPSRGLYPLRDLFIASKGKKVLGCDGAGLELRVFAHFLNDPEYTEIVLHGDIHTHNQLKAGLPIRDMAKTFIYALLYGSGDDNLAAVCGVTVAEMKAIRANFMREIPQLPRLLAAVQAAGNECGYLQAPDGHWGRIRKRDGKLLEHTMLNVLLQMTGSLCMKYARVRATKLMRDERVALDDNGHPAFLADVHDEHQLEVPADEVLEVRYVIPSSDWKEEEKKEYHDSEGRMWSAPECIGDPKEDAEVTIVRQYHRAGQILAEAIRWAGEFLKFRVPMAGEYKIGDSWAETH